ncbi:hypothetical protein Fmac_033009 [Flemingia macrophylla]|uniref:Uncharacterized protein n=1 Tax=Flemingia macrophylla TaxID=520843 RepID=A0ABD1L6Z3_9FABA
MDNMAGSYLLLAFKHKNFAFLSVKDEGLLAPELTENTCGDLRMSKFSSQGSFLKQRTFDYLPENVVKHAINVEQRTKEIFGCLLCEMDIDMPNVDSEIIVGKRSTESVIILSDDEVEPKVSSKKDILSVSEAGQHISDGNIMPHDVGNSLPTADLANLNVSVMKNSKTMKESIQKKASSSNLHDKSGATSFIDAKDLGSCRKEVSSKSKAINSDEAVNARNLNKAYSNMTPKNGDTVPSTCNKMSCDIQDAEDDPLEIALKSVGHVQLHVPKPTVLKRQVIQLKTPFNKYGYLRKLEDPMKRFRPPSLDNWYKAILVINYFATVRLSSFRKD